MNDQDILTTKISRADFAQIFNIELEGLIDRSQIVSTHQLNYVIRHTMRAYNIFDLYNDIIENDKEDTYKSEIGHNIVKPITFKEGYIDITDKMYPGLRKKMRDLGFNYRIKQEHDDRFAYEIYYYVNTNLRVVIPEQDIIPKPTTKQVFGGGKSSKGSRKARTKVLKGSKKVNRA